MVIKYLGVMVLHLLLIDVTRQMLHNAAKHVLDITRAFKVTFCCNIFKCGGINESTEGANRRK